MFFSYILCRACLTYFLVLFNRSSDNYERSVGGGDERVRSVDEQTAGGEPPSAPPRHAVRKPFPPRRRHMIITHAHCCWSEKGRRDNRQVVLMKIKKLSATRHKLSRRRHEQNQTEKDTVPEHTLVCTGRSSRCLGGGRVHFRRPRVQHANRLRPDKKITVLPSP